MAGIYRSGCVDLRDEVRGPDAVAFESLGSGWLPPSSLATPRLVVEGGIDVGRG